MFTWKYQEKLDVSVSPADIWALWAEPETWPLWDKELEWVSIDGPFAKGTKGTMKPKQGPKVAFEFVDVSRHAGFTDRARLPLTVMDFDHRYHSARDGGTLIHAVEFRGLLAPLFGFLIGRNIKKHLREAMIALAERAGSQAEAARKETMMAGALVEES